MPANRLILTMSNQKLDRASDDAVILTAPARLKRVGREMRMLVDGSDDQRIADPSLLRIIARAHDIQGRLSQNTKLTVHDIAREEGVTCSLPFQPPSAPLAGTRHHNGHYQRSSAAPTQCQGVDAQGLATARRLGSATHAARILKISAVWRQLRPLKSALMALRTRRCRTIGIKPVNHEMAPERFSSSRAPR